jgi:hypothetical protein
MYPLPCTVGIAGITCASTTFAAWIAARVTSTETPRLQRPSASGGPIETMATSIGSAPLTSRAGTSASDIGT